MLKGIGTLIVAGTLAWIGWQYVPPRTQEAILDFIGMARRRDTREVRQAITHALLPEDPAPLRAARTADVDRRIRELQRREITAAQGPAAAAAAGFTTDAALADVSASDLLAGASQIVKELERANNDASVKSRLTERILDRILPAGQCK